MKRSQCWPHGSEKVRRLPRLHVPGGGCFDSGVEPQRFSILLFDPTYLCRVTAWQTVTKIASLRWKRWTSKTIKFDRR